MPAQRPHTRLPGRTDRLLGVLGLWLALLLNNHFPFKSLLRAIILLPWIVPTVTVMPRPVTFTSSNTAVATVSASNPSRISALDSLISTAMACSVKNQPLV